MNIAFLAECLQAMEAWEDTGQLLLMFDRNNPEGDLYKACIIFRDDPSTPYADEWFTGVSLDDVLLDVKRFVDEERAAVS